MGTISPVFHLLGNFPDFIDSLRIAPSGLIKLTEQLFTKTGGDSSGPGHLFTFKLSHIYNIEFSETSSTESYDLALFPFCNTRLSLMLTFLKNCASKLATDILFFHLLPINLKIFPVLSEMLDSIVVIYW